MANSSVTVRDNQLEKQRLGYMAITFSNMDNTSEPKIQAGSVVEIAGTLFSVTSEETNADWATIANSTQAYLILDPAADGSSFSAKWTDSAPVWSEAKYGWYGDGTNEDADNRYILRCYKDSSGNYTQKYKYESWYGNKYVSGNNEYSGDNTHSGTETFSGELKFLNYIETGTSIIKSDDSLNSTGAAKEYTRWYIPVQGTVNVYAEYRRTGVETTVYIRIKKNGILQQEFSKTGDTYTSVNYDVSVSTGDYISIEGEGSQDCINRRLRFNGTYTSILALWGDTIIND